MVEQDWTDITEAFGSCFEVQIDPKRQIYRHRMMRDHPAAPERAAWIEGKPDEELRPIAARLYLL